MDIDSLAQALFGSPRAETQEVATDGTTRTYMGVAMSDSEGGTVVVDLGGDVTLPDDLYDSDGNVVAEWDGVGVEMSTSPQVLEGEDVIVTLVGGSATKKPMVTAVAGVGDRQGEAIDEAARAAEVAWNWADDAHVAAAQAQEDAEAAALSAANAASSASDAASSASTASASAQQAVSDASTAATAATNAQASATNAESAAQASAGSASAAATSASQAQTSAGEALTSAQAAQASAASANANATAALNSLATVEDVVDTLSWITQHGTMAKTADTAVDPTKVYFVRDNSGDYAVGNYRYSIVQEPVASGLSDYYELTIDKSVQNYIATHLSLTSEGLWLTPTASNAYKVLVATGSGSTYTTAGTYIIDGSGATVAQFTATGISFAQNKSFYIGDSSSYIHFDGNGHINIGGSGLTIGGYIPTGGVTVNDLTTDAQSATLNSNMSGDIYQSAQPNLTPFFEIAPNDATYWFATGNLKTKTTPLGDGWSHVEYSSLNLNVSPRIGVLNLAPSTKYTVMLEVRNATALTNCKFYLYTDTNSMWAASVNAEVSENGTYYLTGQTKADLTDSAITHLRIFVGHNSSVVNADIRLSLYEGEYDGPFKPYSGTQLFATQTDASNAAKTATSYVTDITGGGIMVHPSTDQTTGVQITDDVDILRDGTSVAEYGETVRIGAESSDHVEIDSNELMFHDGTNAVMQVGGSCQITEKHVCGSSFSEVFYLSLKPSDGATFRVIDKNSEIVTSNYTLSRSGKRCTLTNKSGTALDGETVLVFYQSSGMVLYDEGDVSSTFTTDQASLAGGMFELSYKDTYSSIDGTLTDSTAEISISERRDQYSLITLNTMPNYNRAYMTFQAVRNGGFAGFVLDSGSTDEPTRSLDLIYLDEIKYIDPYSNYKVLGRPTRLTANKSMTLTDTSGWTDGPSVDLTQGHWLVVGVACFNTGSSSGVRKLRAQLRLGTSVYAEGTEINVANNAFGRVEAVAVMSASSDMTATLVLNSGMTFTTAATSYITAILLT